MALSKADYEKVIGRSLSDAEYKNLTAVSGASKLNTEGTARAPASYAGTALPNNNAAAKPNFATYADAQAWYAKHGDIAAGKPLAPPNVTYSIPIRGDENQSVGLWNSTPEEVDAHLKAGNIDKKTADSIKAHIAKTAPLAGGVSGKQQVNKVPMGTYKQTSKVGDEIDSDVTRAESEYRADKKKDAKAPLQALASKGTPMSQAGQSVPYKPAWNYVDPTNPATVPQASTSPLLPAAPQPKDQTTPPPIAYDMGTQNVPATFANKIAPPSQTNASLDGEGAPNRTWNESTMGVTAGQQTPGPSYASGMTVQPETDYASIIANARKKWGL